MLTIRIEYEAIGDYPVHAFRSLHEPTFSSGEIVEHLLLASRYRARIEDNNVRRVPPRKHATVSQAKQLRWL